MGSDDKFILGVTGGVGSGKSRVLEILRQDYGFHVIQADLVARDLMMPDRECYRAVVDCLGASVLEEDGTINRPAMAALIFNDPEKRRQVDSLTHPAVWRAAFREAMDCGGCLAVIEAAVPSKEFRDNCREMWYVYTSEANRLERLRVNRGYTSGKSLSIMGNQMSEEEFRACSHAVIDNNGSLDETRAQIERRLARHGIKPRTR